MKRVFRVLFLFFICLFSINVYADTATDLVPVGTSIDVDTDLFTYSGINLTNTLDDGYRYINFSSITNKSDDSEAISVSIDVLLFDSEKKNIGLVTYCSESDFDGEYSKFTFKNGESTPYSIKIVKKYFIEDKSSNDIAYFSILDENKYCKVGGYDKYSGLTLKEINSKLSSKDVYTKDKVDNAAYSIGSYVINFPSSIAIIIGGCLVVIIINGLILNALHKRIYFESTFLSYIPICSNYIAVKLAFGEIIAKVYIICFVAAIPLAVMGNQSLSMGVSVVSGISSILVLFKLIFKKYDWFCIGKRHNEQKFEQLEKYSNNYARAADYRPTSSGEKLNFDRKEKKAKKEKPSGLSKMYDSNSSRYGNNNIVDEINNNVNDDFEGPSNDMNSFNNFSNVTNQGMDYDSNNNINQGMNFNSSSSVNNSSTNNYSNFNNSMSFDSNLNSNNNSSVNFNSNLDSSSNSNMNFNSNMESNESVNFNFNMNSYGGNDTGNTVLDLSYSSGGIPTDNNSSGISEGVHSNNSTSSGDGNSDLSNLFR